MEIQYSFLEKSMDREVWWAIVHGVIKSQTRLSEFHFYFTSTVSSKAWPQNTTLKLTIMRLFSRRFVFPLLLFLRPPKSCPALCYSMDFTTPGSSVLLYLPELAQSHVHPVGSAIQPSHPLPSPSPPVFNLFQHQGHF